MKVNEQDANSALDNIKMSDEKREAIKQNKASFIKQTQMMFKLWNKVCNKCRKEVLAGVQSGQLNKVSGEEFKELFCKRCQPKYDKVVK